MMVLLVGAFCVFACFALLFGLWGYSGLGWWSFMPFAVLLLVLAGFLLAHGAHVWG